MSVKAETNKKWTSTEDYRDNWERIFSEENKMARICGICGSWFHPDHLVDHLIDCEEGE